MITMEMLDGEITLCQKRLKELQSEEAEGFDRRAMINHYKSLIAAYQEEKEEREAQMKRRSELVTSLLRWNRVDVAIIGVEDAAKFSSYLVMSSKSFVLDPFPDDGYSFNIKNENVEAVLEYLDDGLHAEYSVMGQDCNQSVLG